MALRTRVFPLGIKTRRLKAKIFPWRPRELCWALRRLRQSVSTPNAPAGIASDLSNQSATEALPPRTHTRRNRLPIRKLLAQSLWLRPYSDESAQKATVWYVQAKFPDGIQEGSAVMIRVGHHRQPQAYNVLLTCRHVISRDGGHTPAQEIRCWPNGAGYNPDSEDPRSHWKAEPFLGPQNPGDFRTEGSTDWVLLRVGRDGDDVDQEPYASGFDRPRWTQLNSVNPINPYRLMGFPFGRHLMNRNVASAEVSRAFRLSDTDPKTGTIAITGGEKTGGGFSGGPYFDQDGRVVAIHRGLDGTIVGIHPDGILNELEKHEWSVSRRSSQRAWLWGIRAALVLMIALGVAAMFRSSRPGDQTLHTIAGLQMLHPLGDENQYELTSNGNAKSVAIVDNALRYEAKTFDSYAGATIGQNASLNTVVDQLQYRQFRYGFASPPSNLDIIVHRHREYGTIKQFCDDLLEMTEEERNAWMDPARRPAISFRFETPGDGTDASDRFSTYVNATELYVAYDDPVIRADFSLAKTSPIQVGNQKFDAGKRLKLEYFYLTDYKNNPVPHFRGTETIYKPNITLTFVRATDSNQRVTGAGLIQKTSPQAGALDPASN